MNFTSALVIEYDPFCSFMKRLRGFAGLFTGANNGGWVLGMILSPCFRFFPAIMVVSVVSFFILTRDYARVSAGSATDNLGSPFQHFQIIPIYDLKVLKERVLRLFKAFVFWVLSYVFCHKYLQGSALSWFFYGQGH